MLSWDPLTARQPLLPLFIPFCPPPLVEQNHRCLSEYGDDGDAFPRRQAVHGHFVGPVRAAAIGKLEWLQIIVFFVG